MTGNATISASHTVIMEEFDEDVLENEEIIANVKKFLRDGCGCSRGVKGGPCCQQFSEKLVLSNVNNCLELTRPKKRDIKIIQLCSYESANLLQCRKTTFWLLKNYTFEDNVCK